VRTIGGTDALGHWISTLITSMRETKMFDFFSSGPEIETKNEIKSRADVNNEIQEAASQQSTDTTTEAQTEEKIITLRDALAIMRAQSKEGKTMLAQFFGAGMFGGIMLFMPAFAGFSFYGLKSVFNFISKKYDAHLKHKAIERQVQRFIESLSIEDSVAEELKPPIMDDGNRVIVPEISEESTVQIAPECEFNTNFHPLGKADQFTIFGPEMGIMTQGDLDNMISYEIALYDAKQKELEDLQERIIKYKDFDPITNGIPIGIPDPSNEMDIFPFHVSSKRTTLKSFIVDDLGVSSRILSYNIFVNGKMVQYINDEVLGDTLVDKGDVIWFAPRKVFISSVQNSFAKIRTEIAKVSPSHPYANLLLCDQFLSSNEIDMIYEYYSVINGKLHEKSHSPPDAYADDMKFLIDESISLLEKFTGKKYDIKSLSKILSPVGEEDYVINMLGKLVRGQRFDLTEDFLNRWHAAMWLEFDNWLPSNGRDKAAIELAKLMRIQYDIYGYSDDKSICYFPLRSAYYKLFLLINQRTSIQYNPNANPKRPSIEAFMEFFGYDPHFTSKDRYGKVNYLPPIEPWKNFGDEIIKSLQKNGYPNLISIVKGIVNDIKSILEFYSLGAISDYPNTPKNRLLQDIIMNPYIKELRLLDLKDLSFVLFNHPTFPHVRGQGIKNYINAVYLQSEDIVYGTVAALWYRISTLTFSDFKKVGITEGIDKEILKKFATYANDVILNYLWYNKLSFASCGSTYQTYKLRNLQLDTLLAMWEAAAYATGDAWFSFEEFTRFYLKDKIASFDVWWYISGNRMLEGWKIRDSIEKLDNLISFSGEIGSRISYSFVNVHTFGEVLNTPSLKVQSYIRAKYLLEQLGALDNKEWKTWNLQKPNSISWFEELFQPCKRLSHMEYAKGFKDTKYNEFRDFLVTMAYCELFGTDPISGDNIPNEALKESQLIQYALQHIRKGNKISIALFDMYLTWGSRHPPGESISEMSGEDSIKDLIKRLRGLFEIGISRKSPDPTTGLWITEKDFDRQFPGSLIYRGRYQGKEYMGSLKHLWSEVFTEYSFGEKLIDINNKINTFKDAIMEERNPYRVVMKEFSPDGERRFWDGAERASRILFLLGKNRISPFGHSLSDLMDNWQYKLFKRIFGDLK
jgi:hypothetical protein